MKRNRLLFVLFAFLAITQAFSQGNWELLHPQVTASELVSLDFIDAETGLAVGEVGTILKSTDGGDSWRIIPIPWTTNFTDINFVTPDLALIIGEGGVILRSTDGGENWALQPIEFTNTLNRVRFYDANDGWIVGDAGLILRTIDGGATWNRIITSYKFSLTGLASVDRATWIVIGAGLTVLRTEDSGSSWKKISVEVFNPAAVDTEDFYPQDVFFLNDKVGWLAGNYQNFVGYYEGFLYKTIDGGRSWDIVWMRREERVTLNNLGAASGTGPLRFNGGIQQIYFENEKNGVLLQGAWSTFNNVLYHTDDGGETWCTRMTVYPLSSDCPGRFCFLTPEKAVCTYGGTGFLSSTDGGRYWHGTDFWQRLPRHLVFGDNGHLTAIGAENDVFAIPCGEVERGMGSSNHPVAYHSADYGKNWAAVQAEKKLRTGHTVLLSTAFTLQYLNNSNHLWGLEYQGGDLCSVYETGDAGLTWNYSRSINVAMKRICVFGDTVLQFGCEYVKCENEDVSERYIFTLMHSYDGGQTNETLQFPDIWNEVTLTILDGYWHYYYNHVTGFYFFNSLKGFVVGTDGNILMTTDGGKSWRNIPSGVTDDLQDIRFVNDNTGFIVGNFGRILKTEDGGITWRKTNSGTQNNVYSILFEDELTGWVGTRHGLLYTLDGGESWSPVTGQSINGMVGYLKQDTAGNIYGYWGTLYHANRERVYIQTDRELIPPGFLCVKKAETNLVVDGAADKPKQLQLYPNYPNPFNSNTVIKYDLKQAGEIELAIYNIQGKRVRQLESGTHAAGSHTVRWDGRDQQGQAVSSGVYLIRLIGNQQQQSQKMLYLQ